MGGWAGRNADNGLMKGTTGACEVSANVCRGSQFKVETAYKRSLTHSENTCMCPRSSAASNPRGSNWCAHSGTDLRPSRGPHRYYRGRPASEITGQQDPHPAKVTEVDPLPVCREEGVTSCAVRRASVGKPLYWCQRFKVTLTSGFLFFFCRGKFRCVQSGQLERKWEYLRRRKKDHSNLSFTLSQPAHTKTQAQIGLRH